MCFLPICSRLRACSEAQEPAGGTQNYTFHSGFYCFWSFLSLYFYHLRLLEQYVNPLWLKCHFPVGVFLRSVAFLFFFICTVLAPVLASWFCYSFNKDFLLTWPTHITHRHAHRRSVWLYVVQHCAVSWSIWSQSNPTARNNNSLRVHLCVSVCVCNR